MQLLTIATGILLSLVLVQESEQFPAKTSGDVRNRRSVAIKYSQYRWPNKEILYAFETKSPSRISGVEIVLAEFEERTCVKFKKVPRNDERYKIVVKDNPDTGCYTFPGYLRGENPELKEKELNLGTRCNVLGTIRHEWQHVMGVMHMQSAFDRDKYITFKRNNVASVVNIPQFDIFNKKDSTYFGGHYDFRSTMHYGSSAGALKGKETMVGKRPEDHLMIDHRSNPRLSFFDLYTINKDYDCAANCGKKACTGYIDKNCKCITENDPMFGGSVSNPKWPPTNPPRFRPHANPQTIEKVQSGELPATIAKSEVPGQTNEPISGKSFGQCKNAATVYYVKKTDQFLVALKSSKPPAGCFIENKPLDHERQYDANAVPLVDVYGRVWLIFYRPNYKPKVLLE